MKNETFPRGQSKGCGLIAVLMLVLCILAAGPVRAQKYSAMTVATSVATGDKIAFLDIDDGTTVTGLVKTITVGNLSLYLTPTWTNVASKPITITTAAGATLTLAANSTLVTSGAYSLTLTATAASNVTFPTSGTLATRAGTETLTNKTISGSSNTITNIALGTAVTGTLLVANGGTAYVHSELGGDTVVVTNSDTFTDSGLTVALGTGAWEVETYVGASSSAWASAGAKMQFLFSGTATESAVWLETVNPGGTDLSGSWVTVPTASVGLIGYASLTSADKSVFVRARARVHVTVAGSLSCQMAQVAAVADETVSGTKHSFIRATRVAD